MKNEYFDKVAPYLAEIEAWAKGGAKAKEIGEKLGVKAYTFWEYAKRYPELAEVLKKDEWFRDLTGQKYGRLTAVECCGENAHHNPLWLCKCECGGTVVCSASALQGGHKRTCGCFEEEHPNVLKRTPHGKRHTRLYSIWSMMKNRCSDKSVKNYGGRGISICEEWKQNFEAFYEWAMNNGYSDDLTIDRIDNDGNYCPENCRWATVKEQARNRRTNHHVQYKGKDYVLTDLATELNVSRNTALRRAEKWQEEEKASMKRWSSLV